MSIVSTHVYSLAASAPESVKQICVPATVVDGNYTFSYSVKKGICELSSVDLLLKHYGLLV